MKKHPILLLFLCTLILLVSCSRKINDSVSQDPGFSEYILAHTSGVVSKKSPIRVQLVSELALNLPEGSELDIDLFNFSPKLKGTTKLIDKYTVEFIPDEELKSNQEYIANFAMSELVDIPEDYKTFVFKFKTINQNFAYHITGLHTVSETDLSKQELVGTVSFADEIDTAYLDKFLLSYQNGRQLPVEWVNLSSGTYRFSVQNITRSRVESEVKLSYRGEALGIDKFFETEVMVPAIGKFTVSSIIALQSPDQLLKVHFSDPLKENQNLEGLITIEGVSNLSFSIDNHNISVFLPQWVSGERKVTIHSGVKNASNEKLKKNHVETVRFESIKPSLKLVGKGTILPSSEGQVMFPFEAVNLNAVDVYITKVNEENIVQFFQVNSYSGTSELRRVGEKVTKRTIFLNSDPSLNIHEWNKFSINLSEIIEVEKGAIYRVRIDFRQSFSAYPCGEKKSEDNLTSIPTKEDEEWNEDDWRSYGDFHQNRYYWDDEDYDYNERENPCHSSFYYNRSITRNILASDIGIVAKAGSDKRMHVYVSNIKNTNPITGAQLKFYDYNQKLLGSTTTNSKGMADVYLKKKPFMLIAENGKEKGYLKLRDGESLTMSKFEVGGMSTKKGVKGFVYTERGVWRPGDSIYMTFILEDKEDVLPAGHPVSFKFYNPKNQLVSSKTTSTNVNGMYDFRTSTNSEDPTGSYRAEINVGSRVFSKYLKS